MPMNQDKSDVKGPKPGADFLCLIFYKKLKNINNSLMLRSINFSDF